MSNYKSKNHSKFTLKYHIIFVCKYRKKLLIKYGEEVKQIIKDISYKYDFDILEIEVDKDHIHILVYSEPPRSISKVVNLMKSYTTFHIWKIRS